MMRVVTISRPRPELLFWLRPELLFWPRPELLFWLRPELLFWPRPELLFWLRPVASQDSSYARSNPGLGKAFTLIPQNR